MSTYSRVSCGSLLAGLLLALWWAGESVAQQSAAAEAWRDPASAIRVTLPPSVPLSVVSSDVGESEIYARGGVIVIDLRCDLVVRNEGLKNVRGVTFAVLAQQMTAGGKASVAVPSLNVPAGETFPVRLSLRLLRPLPGPANPLVDVTADGVLLSDFTFQGPDSLQSRRKMTIWELEAQRDREYFKTMLSEKGSDALRREVLASLNRQVARPRLEARLAGTARTASSAASGERIELAFLDLPQAPLGFISGSAQVSGASATSPQVEVKNRSPKRVRYFELAWLVKDDQGKLYAAGSVPGPAPELHLEPGKSLSTSNQRRFAFAPKAARPEFSIRGMSGYVSQVQFDDGTYWIPSRGSLETASLMETVPVSAEEQRLTDLYRTKGLQALITELAKF